MPSEALLASLQALFPGTHPVTPDPVVARVLPDGETVVWQGTRENVGEYSMPRYLVGMIVMAALIVMALSWTGLPIRDLVDELIAGGKLAKVLVPVGVIVFIFISA